MRPQGRANQSTYHYKVLVLNNDGAVDEIYYAKTQKDIRERFGIPRSAVYYKVNPDPSRIRNAWEHFEIEKLNPPLPVFQKSEVIYT